MSRNNLGKIVITPQGVWNEETHYKRLDLVYALNGSFLARENNQGVSVTDTSIWQPVAGRGPAGTGNVSVHETGLIAGKKYLFIPSNNNSAEGIFEEYIPVNLIQQQADWRQTQTDQPDYIKNKPELFSGSYNDLENKPELFNGNYNNLKNKPELFSGNYNDLENKPSLFSGSYFDLADKPSIPKNVSDLENDSQYITASQVSSSFQGKETGKGLSTHDYTTSEKEKLAGIEVGAQKNINPIHKSIILEPSNWQLFEDANLYRAPITDVDIVDGVIINIGSDLSTIEVWNEAGGLNVASEGYPGHFYAYVKNQPEANVLLRYSIEL